MSSELIKSIRARNWVRTMARLATHPAEAVLAGAPHEYGMRPLHYACWNQAPLAVVQALLYAHPGAALTPTGGGLLPLHYAAYHQAPLDVVQLLLRAYPEAVCIASNSGWLPLHWATLSTPHASVGVPPVVAALLAAHPEAALEHDNDGDLPDLARYPAAAIAAALRAQAAARRRLAMIGWVAAWA